MNFKRIDHHLTQQWNISIIAYPLGTAVFSTLLAHKLLGMPWLRTIGCATVGSLTVANLIGSRQIAALDQVLEELDQDTFVSTSQLLFWGLIAGIGVLTFGATKQWQLGLLASVNLGLGLQSCLILRERKMKIAPAREAMYAKLWRECESVYSLPQCDGTESPLQRALQNYNYDLDELRQIHAEANRHLRPTSTSSFAEGRVAFLSTLNYLATSDLINRLEILKAKIALADTLSELHQKMSQELASINDPDQINQLEQHLIAIEEMQHRLNQLALDPRSSWQADPLFSQIGDSLLLRIDALHGVIGKYATPTEQLRLQQLKLDRIRDLLENIVAMREECPNNREAVEFFHDAEQDLTQVTAMRVQLDQLAIEPVETWCNHPLLEPIAESNFPTFRRVDAQFREGERARQRLPQRKRELQIVVQQAAVAKRELNELGLLNEPVGQQLNMAHAQCAVRLACLPTDFESCSLADCLAAAPRSCTAIEQLQEAVRAAQQVCQSSRQHHTLAEELTTLRESIRVQLQRAQQLQEELNSERVQDKSFAIALNRQFGQCTGLLRQVSPNLNSYANEELIFYKNKLTEASIALGKAIANAETRTLTTSEAVNATRAVHAQIKVLLPQAQSALNRETQAELTNYPMRRTLADAISQCEALINGQPTNPEEYSQEDLDQAIGKMEQLQIALDKFTIVQEMATWRYQATQLLPTAREILNRLQAADGREFARDEWDALSNSISTCSNFLDRPLDELTQQTLEHLQQYNCQLSTGVQRLQTAMPAAEAAIEHAAAQLQCRQAELEQQRIHLKNKLNEAKEAYELLEDRLWRSERDDPGYLKRKLTIASDRAKRCLEQLPNDFATCRAANLRTEATKIKTCLEDLAGAMSSASMAIEQPRNKQRGLATKLHNERTPFAQLIDKGAALQGKLDEANLQTSEYYPTLVTATEQSRALLENLSEDLSQWRLKDLRNSDATLSRLQQELEKAITAVEQAHTVAVLPVLTDEAIVSIACTKSHRFKRQLWGAQAIRDNWKHLDVNRKNINQELVTVIHECEALLMQLPDNLKERPCNELKQWIPQIITQQATLQSVANPCCKLLLEVWFGEFDPLKQRAEELIATPYVDADNKKQLRFEITKIDRRRSSWLDDPRQCTIWNMKTLRNRLEYRKKKLQKEIKLAENTVGFYKNAYLEDMEKRRVLKSGVSATVTAAQELSEQLLKQSFLDNFEQLIKATSDLTALLNALPNENAHWNFEVDKPLTETLEERWEELKKLVQAAEQTLAAPATNPAEIVEGIEQLRQKISDLLPTAKELESKLQSASIISAECAVLTLAVHLCELRLNRPASTTDQPLAVLKSELEQLRSAYRALQDAIEKAR